MIYCLSGKLLEIDSLSYTAVVDCAGVGFAACVTASTLSKLIGCRGEDVRLYTHMQVREDAVELYGFYDTEERDAYRMLITVSGVGPKAAMAILSVLSPKELALAVSAGDSRAISRAQGVGAKIAARVVLELKDKFAKAFPVSDAEAGEIVSGRAGNGAASVPAGGVLNDARDALVALGFSRQEAQNAVKNAGASGSVEEIIKRALANLMKG